MFAQWATYILFNPAISLNQTTIQLVPAHLSFFLATLVLLSLTVPKPSLLWPATCDEILSIDDANLDEKPW